MVDVRAAVQVAKRLKVFPNSHTAGLAEAIALFAPQGWALCGNWHAEGTLRAVKAAADGATPAELDEMITETWNTEMPVLLRNVGTPLRRLAAGENAVNRVLWARADLVDKAAKHHEAGAYEASIPILHAQIDGLTIDLTGKSFFTKSNTDPFVDDETLAGLESNLPVVRALFSQDVKTSEFHGSVSRHGVLHGRDLGYANRVNSTKSLVLMAALVEYFPKLARQRADDARAEHEAAVAGSTELDSYGRLVDDREVPELLNFAYEFDSVYMNKTLFREPFDVASAARTAAKKAKLDPAKVTVGRDNVGVWWHYTIPAGQVLAYAARPSTDPKRPAAPDSWRWDRPHSPERPPWVDPTGWHDYHDPPGPPNWEPRLSMLDGPGQ